MILEEPTESEMGCAALEFAALGWPVFPCHPKTKRPLTPNGYKDATVSRPLLEQWWLRWPKAMIGVPTGMAIGAFVVDLDAGTDIATGEVFSVEGLTQALEEAIGAALPPALVATTPRGGCHLYFQMPEAPVGNRAGLLARTDVRGDGGYVIVPPSRRTDGRQYTWKTAPPTEMAPATPPPDLLTLISRPRSTASGAHPPERSDAQASAGATRPYGVAAMDREVDDLARASRGSRNDALNRAAFRLGQLIATGQVAQDEVESSLLNAAHANGLTADDGDHAVRKTIASGMNAGMKSPRSPSSRQVTHTTPAGSASARSNGLGAGDRSANRAQCAGPPPEYGDGEGAIDRWLATFPQTDLGNIERYVQRHRWLLVHCPALGWLHWNGMCWSRQGAKARAISAGHDTVRAIQDEAASIRGTSWDRHVGVGSDNKPIMLSDQLQAWGRRSEQKNRMALADDAAAYLKIEVDELDADPWKINLTNGTLVVRREWTNPLPTGWQQVNENIRIKPHDPSDWITMIAGVAFDREAQCPVYDTFMRDVQPNAGTREFLDDWDGYSLTGDASEQKLVFNYGAGKNGKSTHLALRLAIAGDYARSIPIETFVNEGRARSAGQATPDLAMLRRKRLLATSEPEKGWKLNEALIKTLTGGDEVPVRELHQSYFMLKPEFKLTISGNHKPNIGGGEAESGMWRRLVLVPWAVRISKGQRDPHLPDKLKAEASGVLNRWLVGLTRWLQRGLRVPDEIAGATERFRVDSDPLGRWIDEATRVDSNAAAAATPAHASFVAYCRANGEREWTQTGFGRALSDRGFVRKKNNVWYWLGFELMKHASDFGNACEPAPARPHEGDTGRPIRRRPQGPSDTDDDDVPF